MDRDTLDDLCDLFWEAFCDRVAACLERSLLDSEPSPYDSGPLASERPSSLSDEEIEQLADELAAEFLEDPAEADEMPLTQIQI